MKFAKTMKIRVHLTEEALGKYSALYKVPTHQLFMKPLGGGNSGDED